MRYQVRILKRIKRFRKEVYSFFIFGLGNPGTAYRKTLHNAGFLALDRLAQREGISFTKMRGNTLVGSLEVSPEEWVFVGKPQTYMNLSGEAVRYYYLRHRFPLDRLIVIHDDLDIAPGRIKIKVGGGSGGHKGIVSIVGAIGSSDFTRIKIGVGRPPKGIDPAEYVLRPPSSEDEEDFYCGVHHALSAIMLCLKGGVDKAAIYYNSNRPYEEI